MAERKLFMQIQGSNIMYPNLENMIVMLITKVMEIAMSIHVCLISWMNFIMWKIVERKLFLQIQSINIVYLNAKNMIVIHITKRIEIVMSICVCLILRINIGYMEKG